MLKIFGQIEGLILGVIVGARSTDQYPNVAFRWTHGAGFDDLNGTSANAINDAGKIAGSTLTGAFTLDGNSMKSWDETAAYDINDFDEVVGYSESSAGNHAFIWDTASGMRDLNELAAATGCVLSGATAINNAGDIVGTGLVNGQSHGFLLTDGLPPAPLNESPVAIASSNVSSGKAPLPVSFSGDGSTDPDCTIVSYSWDFGDGVGTSNEVNPTYTYITDGSYIAELTVTDNGGMTDTAVVDITVRKSKGRH